MSDVERLLAVHDCLALMYEYAHRLDHGPAESIHELFTEDGAWTSPTIDAVGSNALRALFAHRDGTRSDLESRYVVVNTNVVVTDANHASGRSVAIEFRGELGGDDLPSDTTPLLVGDYEDDFLRVDGVWRFERRNVVVAMKREGQRLMTVPSESSARS